MPPPCRSAPRSRRISLLRDGSVRIGTEWIAERGLPAALQRAQLREPDSRVVIRADRRLRYGAVLAAMRAARAAGFSGVGLVTRKLDAPCPPLALPPRPAESPPA